MSALANYKSKIVNLGMFSADSFIRFNSTLREGFYRESQVINHLLLFKGEFQHSLLFFQISVML